VIDEGLKEKKEELPTFWKSYLSFAIVFTLVVVPFMVSGCMGVGEAQKQALQLEKAMHDQMARGDFAGIYNGADERYRNAISRDKSDALYSSIVRKLGSPLDCKPGSTMVMAATSGTTIKSVCTTTFSKNATGVETFVWMKQGDQFHLAGYHISSDALIER
jgi:hypothetical protein